MVSHLGTLPSSGNAVIDEAHRRMAALVAEAARLWLNNAPREQYVRAIRAFRDAAQVHFAEEEMILRGAGLGALEAHHREHVKLIAQLDDLLVSLEDRASTQRDYQIVDRIEAMLFEHELVEDGDYLIHLREDMKSVLVPWRQDMAVGIASVDRHHQVLLDTFNRLVTRIHNKLSKDEILAGLLELESQASIHFPEEEEILKARVDASAYLRHHLDHGQFMAQISKVIDGYRNDRIDIKAVVEGFLKYLLVDHITVIDRGHLDGARSTPE